MNTSIAIIKMLSVKGFVIIPEVGSITIKRVPSQRVGDVLMPPVSQLVFDSQVKIDDGKLVDYIVEETNETMDVVGLRVANYIKRLKKSIETKGESVIVGLGVFKKENNTLIFVESADGKWNIPNVIFEPISLVEPVKEVPQPIKPVVDNTKQTDVKNTPPPKNTQPRPAATPKPTNKKKVLVPILVLVLAVVAFCIVFMLNKSVNKPSQVAIIDNIPPVSHIDSTDIVTVQDSTEVDSTINYYAQFKEFYLVVGSFTAMKNALELKVKLELQGLNPAIVIQDNNKIRVHIGRYENHQKALDELYKVRAQKGDSFVWLLSL